MNVGAKRIARLMKSQRNTTPSTPAIRAHDPMHPHPIVENMLARTFDPDVIGGHRVWARDIASLLRRAG